MYKKFYGLKALPFQITTDPTFLWLGEKHREAISMLKYGIQGNGHSGLLLLTGDVGTGKTTLINALFKSLDRRVIRAAVTNPNLDGLDFLNYIATKFGSKTQFKSKSQFLYHFERFLKNAQAKGRKVLLVIDEAQLLSDRLLEEIRLFSNIEVNGSSLINTFLIGQNELRTTLSKPLNRPLKQRITLNYNIDALIFEETQEYIKYRLQVAGTSEAIFDPSAVQLIHRQTLGLPREINVLCDHALLTGYVQNKKRIDAAIIRECVNDIAILPQSSQANIPSALEQPNTPTPEGSPLPIYPEQTKVKSEPLRKEIHPQQHIMDIQTEPQSKKRFGFFLIVCLIILGCLSALLLFF